MDTQPTNNRIEKELAQWQVKEERLRQLFSGSKSFDSALLREKLKYYEGISERFTNSKNLDERVTLRIIKQERNAIEQVLYPNLLVRLLRRLFIRPVKDQIRVVQNIRAVENNSQSLQDRLQRAGFNTLGTQLEQKLKEGDQQFSIPVSYYLNDKERLEHQLSFAKDSSGQYQFEGFRSSLFNELKPEENRQQYFQFKEGMHVDATEAYNLLAGRSVHKAGNWLQLDLNDKDAQGNYRIKEFPVSFGYDLKEVIQKLPIKELEDKIQINALQTALMQGGRQSVSFPKDGKEQRYYIEANPQFKSVTIYDEHFRKVTLATATGSKASENLKSVQKVNEKQEESQSKRAGMRVI